VLEDWPAGLTANQRAFLTAYVAMGSVSAAAHAAQLSRQAVYAWKTKDETFAQVLEIADQFATENMEGEAHRRAVTGLRKLKFHKGEAIRDPETGRPYVEHEYSDALLMFLLRARSAKYREGDDRKDGGQVYRDILVIAPREGDAPGQATLPV
jgi:hypothetical protein